MVEKQNSATMIQKDVQLPGIEVNNITIKNLIHVLRGEQVILAGDLAMLYQVETRALNQAVKRNIERFPENFRFQLTEEEYENLKSQFVISSLELDGAHGGRRYLPYAFTEQGIAMLSAVLRSDVAIQVSIKIMNTFVELRRFLANNSLLFEKINEIEVKQIEYQKTTAVYQKSTEEKFDQIFTYISEHEEVSQKIFFDGQIYDAFSLLVQLVNRAEQALILIDNYIDIGTLNILAKKKPDIKVIIYTTSKSKITERDIKSFNQQYPTLEIKYTEVFHDRFLIVDSEYAYHIGASIKDAGKKCFGINVINDKSIIKDILERLQMEEEDAASSI